LSFDLLILTNVYKNPNIVAAFMWAFHNTL